MRKKRILIILTLIIILITIISLRGCLRPELPKDPYIKLYLSEEKALITLRLEEYLVGCVAAEMPSSFELEALKAQAVCARTYALRKLLDSHPYPQGADLSDDITTCQAYISPQEFYQRHPQKGRELWAKVKKAVRATEGMVILYESKPIDAVYHSTCGGQTISAQEAWGNEVNYLKSTKCPYCKESKHYSTVQVFSYGDFNGALGTNISSKSQIQVSSHDSGRASQIKLGNNSFSGAKFRRVLNLPSTWLTLSLNKETIRIKARGYGHGAGLCQYGANGLAKTGSGYEKILKHYYKGIQIYKINY